MELIPQIFQSYFGMFAGMFIVCLIIFMFLLRRRFYTTMQRVQNSRWLGQNYVWIFMVFGCALIVVAIILYVHQLPGLIQKTIRALQSAFNDNPEDDEKLRNLAYAFAALAGALTIMATIPFQLIRVWLNERAARTAEQSHITDQINRAVEGVGAEKTVMDETGERTVPNVEVRVGAVYALERIGQDSARDHIQIMEILTAYIRENSSNREVEKRSALSISEGVYKSDTLHDHDMAFRNASASARNALIDPAFYKSLTWVWTRNLSAKTDIQATMRVIGRRNAEQQAIERADKRYGESGYLLDLRKTNLQGVDISRLDVFNALLSETCLDGANLNLAGMDKVDLRWAQMNGVNLEKVRLCGADLSEAHIEGADMLNSNLEGAKLHETHLKDCDLSFTNANGTDFSQAILKGISLNYVTFNESTNWNVSSCEGSALQANDFSNRSDVLPSFFEQAFGDGSVRLPKGLTAGEGSLSHWEAAELETREFFRRWRSWQNDIGYISD